MITSKKTKSKLLTPNDSHTIVVHLDSIDSVCVQPDLDRKILGFFTQYPAVLALLFFVTAFFGGVTTGNPLGLSAE